MLSLYWVDSLVINTNVPDVYKEMYSDHKFLGSFMDLSDVHEIPDEYKELLEGYDMKKNKKRLGLFSDELGGDIMTKFIGLCGKSYAYECNSGVFKNKAKGVKKHISKCFSMNEYEGQLLGEEAKYCNSNGFRSKSFGQLSLLRETKKSLSAFNDKRITDETGDSKPYGYIN